jgi:hypothetical protein
VSQLIDGGVEKEGDNRQEIVSGRCDGAARDRVRAKRGSGVGEEAIKALGVPEVIEEV